MSRGYLLPDEILSEVEPEFACAIVFFPNYPEARRALEGSIEYLGTWIAWEKDGTNKALEFANLWKLANEQTRDCLEMATCLDDLVNAINNLHLVATYNQDCFCDSVEINPPNPVIPDIQNEVGDPPTTYGGEEVSDWLQWRRKVCANANSYVDLVKAQNNQLRQAISLSVVAVALIGGILAVLASGGLLIAVAWGTVVSIVTGLVAAGGTAAFDTFNDDIEAVREDIVKAIVCSEDLGAIIQGAISSEAWTLFYQFVDWTQAAQAIRAGEVSGEFFDGTQESDECDNLCLSYDWEITLTFDSGPEIFNLAWKSDEQLVYQQITPGTIIGQGELVELEGIVGPPPGAEMHINHFSGQTKILPDIGTPSPPDNYRADAQVYTAGGWYGLATVSFDDMAVWHDFSWTDLENPLPIQAPGIRVLGIGLGHGGGTYQGFDNITIRGIYSSSAH